MQKDKQPPVVKAPTPPDKRTDPQFVRGDAVPTKKG